MSDKKRSSVLEAFYAASIPFIFLLLVMGCGDSGGKNTLTHELQNPLVESGRWSLLHEAVNSGNSSKLRELLSQGANPVVVSAKKEDHHISPLHLAAQRGDVVMAQILLSKGARVNQEMSTGETPLHLAVRAGHRAMVTFLLDQGADRSVESLYVHKPIKIAEEMGRQDLVDVLSK